MTTLQQQHSEHFKKKWSSSSISNHLNIEHLNFLHWTRIVCKGRLHITSFIYKYKTSTTYPLYETTRCFILINKWRLWVQSGLHAIRLYMQSAFTCNLPLHAIQVQQFFIIKMHLSVPRNNRLCLVCLAKGKCSLNTWSEQTKEKNANVIFFCASVQNIY